MSTKISIPVDRIRILQSDITPDQVFIFTKLPASMPKLSKQGTVIRIDCEAETGPDYVAKHFPGVQVEVLEL